MSREKLRTFHVTGSGLEELQPPGPLRPSGLPQPDAPPPPVEAAIVQYLNAMLAARKAARERLLNELRNSRNRVAAILHSDSQHELAHSVQGLAASLGKEGAEFLDPVALATALRPGSAKGPARLEPDRRERLSSALEKLDRAIDWLSAEALVRLVHSPENPQNWDAPGAVREAVGNPARAAEEHAASLAWQIAEVVRGLRLAQLEGEGLFRPEFHAERLAHVTWQSASPDELAAMPAIVVVESVERLVETGLTSLNSLFRFGMPVQVLALRAFLGADDFAWAAVAHPEVLVAETALSNPDHWNRTVERMVHCRRPVLAVWDTGPLGYPLFVYDPDAGEHFTARLRVEPEARNGSAPTPAHVAATQPEWRRHFRVIPPSMWDPEQLSAADYLDRYQDRPPAAVPFVPVEQQGVAARAVFSRELATLCRQRLRARRVLEELAHAPVPANEAAAVPSAAVSTDAAQVEARVREAIEQGRKEGAADAVLRVVGLLLNPDTAAAPQPPPATPLTALAPAGVQRETPAPQAAPAPAEAAASTQSETAGPYIDSFLCTSCNDCFKVNPRLFQYNENKQAYIADASAGTYAELVKAAEGCPAKCIHVGDPRPSDTTATAAVLARAAKLR